MRNNTLIKLLAVLAMCFLVCAAFAACSEEKPEDTAKVVAGVAFDADGNLVITYDDESTDKIALPAPTCKHNNVAKFALEEHTASANGTYLEVCDDCGYSWIKYEKRHDWVAEPNTVPATCKSEGYTTDAYCSICLEPSEKKDIVPAIDHKYENGNYIVDADKNICVDGGKILCDFDAENNCGATKDVAPAANEGIDGQHTVTVWDFETNAPTLDKAGIATGTCTVCDEKVAYDLPAILNANGTYNDAYTFVEKSRTSCSEALTATVTLKANANISYANVQIIAAGGSHMLKDKNGDLQFIHTAGTVNPANGELYSYSANEYTGIKSFADKEINSCTPILAYYVCENEKDGCKAVVDVYAYTEHDWGDPVKTDPAQCGVKGTNYFECADCEEKKTEEIPALEHVWKYDAKLAPTADGKYTTVKTCNLCHEAEDYIVENPVIDDVKVTCEEDGVLTVTATLPDGTKGEYKKVTPALHHILIINGEPVQVQSIKNDGTPVAGEDVIYKWYEGCGILSFDKKDITEKAVVAYFVCANTTEEHKEDEGVVAVWVVKANADNSNFNEYLPGDPDAPAAE